MKNNFKPILDVACGGKMFYFDKNDPRVLFCDKRIIEPMKFYKGRNFSVQPDVQCDFRALPFTDNLFSVVVFDPPHILRTGPTGIMQLKYGSLQDDWQELLTKGFAECFRVLRPGGVLIFKWAETDIPLKEILALTPEHPVFGHRSGKASKTHWLCFLKNCTN